MFYANSFPPCLLEHLNNCPTTSCVPRVFLVKTARKKHFAATSTGSKANLKEEAVETNTRWEAPLGNWEEHQSRSGSTVSEIELPNHHQEESWESLIEQLQNIIQEEDYSSFSSSSMMGFAWNISQESPFLLGHTSKKVSLNWEMDDREEDVSCIDLKESGRSTSFSAGYSDNTRRVSQLIYCNDECSRYGEQQSPSCTFSNELEHSPLKRNNPLGTKTCVECQSRVPAAIATCTFCGHSFRIKKGLKKQSSGERGKKVSLICSSLLFASHFLQVVSKM